MSEWSREKWLEDRKGKKYRPANGSEGSWFFDQWCDRCRHDDDFKRGIADGCEILGRSLCFDVDEQEYPSEWRYNPDTSEPECTAYKVSLFIDDRRQE